MIVATGGKVFLPFAERSMELEVERDGQMPVKS